MYVYTTDRADTNARISTKVWKSNFQFIKYILHNILYSNPIYEKSQVVQQRCQKSSQERSTWRKVGVERTLCFFHSLLHRKLHMAVARSTCRSQTRSNCVWCGHFVHLSLSQTVCQCVSQLPRVCEDQRFFSTFLDTSPVVSKSSLRWALGHHPARSSSPTPGPG